MKRRRKKRTIDEVSTTPEAQAVRRAVGLAGGSAKVGLLVDRCEQAVQKWFEKPDRMSPENARVLCRAADYAVPLAEMLPGTFANLTVQELGYLPKTRAKE